MTSPVYMQTITGTRVQVLDRFTARVDCHACGGDGWVDPGPDGESTCPAYGWLPELSGESVADAIDAHGPALCSVCFPSAPVEWQGGKLTKAQAAKVAA